MTRAPATPAELAALEDRLDGWLAAELARNEAMVDMTRDEEIPRRWYVRLAGDERDFTAIWLTLGQRTLKYETYVLPAPEENHAQLFEWLLRQNYGLVGAQFGIGPEDAVFLTGELPVHALDEHEFDRVVGSVFAYVERFFRTALAIGFASRLAPTTPDADGDNDDDANGP